jgi:hypothetical protein
VWKVNGCAGLTQLERIVRELQGSVMRVRMVPISFVFSRFPRRKATESLLGKRVELKMSGGEIGADKMVLEDRRSARAPGTQLRRPWRGDAGRGLAWQERRRNGAATACHRGSNIQVGT